MSLLSTRVWRRCALGLSEGKCPEVGFEADQIHHHLLSCRLKMMMEKKGKQGKKGRKERKGRKEEKERLQNLVLFVGDVMGGPVPN